MALQYFPPFSTFQLTRPREIQVSDRKVIAYTGFQKYGLLPLMHRHSQISGKSQSNSRRLLMQRQQKSGCSAELNCGHRVLKRNLNYLDLCKFNFMITGRYPAFAWAGCISWCSYFAFHAQLELKPYSSALMIAGNHIARILSGAHPTAGKHWHFDGNNEKLLFLESRFLDLMLASWTFQQGWNTRRL